MKRNVIIYFLQLVTAFLFVIIMSVINMPLVIGALIFLAVSVFVILKYTTFKTFKVLKKILFILLSPSVILSALMIYVYLSLSILGDSMAL